MAPSRRRVLLAAGVAVAALIAFVLYWFQPQALFIDERVDEAIPMVGAGPTVTGPSTPMTAPTTAPVEPVEPVERARGAFVSLDHGTAGTARVLDLADGSRILRLEMLDTSNGPDLYLYLTANPPDGAESAFDDDFVNLGRLKGNQGDQNYELAADVDLARYSTVVIWCDRFDSAFGAALLAA